VPFRRATAFACLPAIDLLDEQQLSLVLRTRDLLSLLVQKKSRQKKHTLAWRFSGSCPKSARPRPVFRGLCVPAQAAQSARSIAPTLRASRPRPPPCEGARRAARVVRAEATADRSGAKALLRLGAQERAALDSGVPIAWRRQRSIRPRRGRAHDARDCAVVHGRTISATRPLTWTRSAGCAPGAMRWGVFFWLPFLARARKVTRSTEGRAKAFALKARSGTKTLDYTRLLPRALRAIRCANVGSGIVPTRSGFRRNDEQEQRHWIPASSAREWHARAS